MSPLTGRIYTLERDGSFGCRDGIIEPVDEEITLDAKDATRPLHVEGILPRDLVVFLVFDESHHETLSAEELLLSDTDDKNDDEIGYLVTHRDDDGTAIITPGDLLERDPTSWSSPGLLAQLSTVDPGEFVQFSLPNLWAYAWAQK